MRLWLWYAPGTEQDIERACRIAENVLRRHGTTAQDAYAAAVAAHSSQSETTDEDSAPGMDAIGPWFEAENAAFEELHRLCGIWPGQASLIVVETSE